MRFSTYIAKRFMLGGKGAGTSRFTGWIAIIGMAIGCFALIISIAVLNGFELQVADKIIGFEGDLRISKIKPSIAEDIYNHLKSDNNISQIVPFMERKGIVLTNSNSVRMVSFKAVPFDKINEFYNLGLDSIIVKDNTPQLLLGTLLAERLQVEVGDNIKIMSPIDNPIQIGLPRILNVEVAGIFQIDVLDYDDRIVFIPLKYGKQLFLRKKSVDGYDTRLVNRNNIDVTKEELRSHFGSNARIENWEDIHEGLFNAMRMERIGAIIVLSLIVLVAAFNLTSTLVLVTYQKIREIGILRTLGASANVIKTIIIKQGILIGGIGAIVGLVLSIGIVILQNSLGFLPLPQDIYAFDTLPMILSVWDVILVPFIAFLLIILASYIAAKRAMLIEPKEAVHLEK
ncbi:MAG: FtsX-like permease family protein [Planctomycetia bacterium]|nr:FtsX-like permease family protein [Planctomycetia bacterium]